MSIPDNELSDFDISLLCGFNKYPSFFGLPFKIGRGFSYYYYIIIILL